MNVKCEKGRKEQEKEEFEKRRKLQKAREEKTKEFNKKYENYEKAFDDALEKYLIKYRMEVEYQMMDVSLFKIKEMYINLRVRLKREWYQKNKMHKFAFEVFEDLFGGK